jgi:hypothetical protein
MRSWPNRGTIQAFSRTEENHEELSQGSRCLGWYSNPAPSENETNALPLRWTTVWEATIVEYVNRESHWRSERLFTCEHLWGLGWGKKGITFSNYKKWLGTLLNYLYFLITCELHNLGRQSGGLHSKGHNYDEFKSGGLHEMHIVATLNLGNQLVICLKTEGLKIVSTSEKTQCLHYTNQPVNVV